MGYPILQSQTAQPLLFWLVSSSDHITGLTGKSASVVVKLSKNGATGVTPSGAISEVDATNFPGLYAVAGNATDAGTLGPLALHAKDAASDPYDDLFPVVAYNSQAATNLGLTALPAVASGSAGAIPTTGTGANQISLSSGQVLVQSGTGTGQLSVTSGVVAADVTQWSGSNVPSPAVTGVPKVDVAYVNGTAATAYDGTATAGSATTITLDSGDPATANDLTGRVVTLVGGTGQGQSRLITAYNTGTRIATVSPNWAANPASGSQYQLGPFADAAGEVLNAVAGSYNTAGTIGAKINSAASAGDPWATAIPGSYGAGTAGNLVGNGLTASAIAGDVLNAVATTYNTAGSIGAKINSAASAGDPWTTSLPGTYAAGQAGYIVGNNLNAAITTRQPSGNVTVGGYAAGQDPATLVLDVAQSGHNTAGTIGAKIGTAGGYTFPARFSSLSIDVSGRVDLGSILGTASAGAAGYVGVDWAHVNAQTTAVNLSGTTISTAQAVASVSGPVPVQTGTGANQINLSGGNLAGPVPSVAGNVGGNVVGSVGSVSSPVAITSAIKKNQALNGFEFPMTDATTHAPKPGLGTAVTATRSLDGGAFAACANAVAEVGSGIYAINLATTDTNANVVTYNFAATGADTTQITVFTQP